MKKIPFTKMSGAGNDFVVIDNRNNIITDPVGFVQNACRKKYGIGADGALLVEKSTKADFTMKYYNSDGTCGGMCGNGGRCISKFVYTHNIITKTEFTFEAFDYIYKAKILPDGNVELLMKNPSQIQLQKKIVLDGKEVTIHSINTGAPHAVMFTNENGFDLETMDFENVGRKLRFHFCFGNEGSNINLIQEISPNILKIRTYERGVEAETLACGTGSVASSVAYHLLKKVNPPITLLVRSGEKLQVNFQSKNEVITNVTLTGPAEEVFEGEFPVK